MAALSLLAMVVNFWFAFVIMLMFASLGRLLRKTDTARVPAQDPST